jgi:hypothetical protein
MQTETPTYESPRVVRDLYRRLNDAGEGTAPGRLYHSAGQAAENEGWEVLYLPATEHDYLVAYDESDDGFMLVANVSGPWAVRVPDHSLAAWAAEAGRQGDGEMVALVRRARDGDINALRGVWDATVNALAINEEYGPSRPEKSPALMRRLRTR